MVGHAVHLDRIGGVGQTFDDVAHFQVILAIAVWREPPGGQVVLIIADHKRIVEGFCDLMTKTGDVDKGIAEESGTDPCGVGDYIATLAISIALIARFNVVAVKSEDAAIIRISVEV